MRADSAPSFVFGLLKTSSSTTHETDVPIRSICLCTVPSMSCICFTEYLGDLSPVKRVITRVTGAVYATISGRTSCCQHRLKHGNRRVFRFKLQDYLFLKKINTLQGNAITIHSMSMTLGV